MAERKTKHTAKPARVQFVGEAEQALAEIADELEALDAEEVLYVNVDVPRSVSIVIGAEPQIAAHAGQIDEELPHHDVEGLTRLRTYALAALYANVLAQPPAKRGDIATLVDKGTALKLRLIVAAESLAHDALLDAQLLAEIKSGNGHLDLASDLIALGAMYQLGWEEIKGKSIIAYADLEEASRVGTELLGALGARDHVINRATPEAMDRKHRAFTLLVRAYNEARRALSYLRFHEDDVDEIAPSLYKRAKKRGVAAASEDAAPSSEDGEDDRPPADDDAASTSRAVSRDAAGEVGQAGDRQREAAPATHADAG